MKIWIPRTHYYFTSPLIRRLIKTEERLNSEIIKKAVSEKMCYKPIRLFLIYEQLYCMAIKSDGVLRYGVTFYTPYLLADVLDGNFTTEEVEVAINELVNIGLIVIDENHSIILTDFKDEIPDKGDALLAESESKEVTTTATSENPPFSSLVGLLIEGEFISKNDRLNKKGSKIEDFENFFINLKKSNPSLSEDEIKKIILSVLDAWKNRDSNLDPIKSTFAYFSKSFNQALKVKATKKLEKTVDELDYTWEVK